MRMQMTPNQFRQSMDGFGLAIMLLGYALLAVMLVVTALPLFGIRSDATPPQAFQGIVLVALGGGLRLIVRIDKRLAGDIAETGEEVR